MNKTWVLIAAVLGSSMSFVDGTAVNVALPIMQRELHADAGEMQWVIEGYALFLAALLLVGGSLGDVFGRKKMFAAGIAIFALASVACAFAPNVALLVAARCIQGIGGALAMPESLALISASFTGDERGRAIGTWSGFASLTAAAGPVIGGFLAQTASWRWVFIINVPLAIAVLAITLLRVPESRDENAGHTIDWTGALLATAGLGGLVYGLIRLQADRADGAGLASVALGCAILVLFVLAQRRARRPMMPLAMFASRTFSVANLYTFLFYMALGGSLYFFPFVLIDVQRYEPTAAGAAFLPFVILQFGLSRWSGSLVPRFGARLPLVVGATIGGVAFVLFAVPGIGGTYWTTYFPAVVTLGIGAAVFIAPLTTTVFDASDPAQSGIASAVNNALARAAGLVAIAVFGVVLAAVFDGGFEARLAHRHIAPQTQRIVERERGRLTAGTVPGDVPAADRDAVGLALRSGYIAGFRAVMLVSAGLAFGAALLALLLLPRRTPART